MPKTDDATNNLSHIIIRAKDKVVGWIVDDYTYYVKTRVPNPAIVALIIDENVATGMKTYIEECLTSQEARDKFATDIYPNTDVAGLSAIIEKIIEVTTPFDLEKPSD